VIEQEFSKIQMTSTSKNSGTLDSLFFILVALASPNIVFINSKKIFLTLAIVQFLTLLYGFEDVQLALIIYFSLGALAFSVKFSIRVFFTNFK